MRNIWLKRLKNILAFIGPGLFLIGYNIGTGSVTTMASAGSRWGMSLSWTVVLSCLFTYIGIMAFGRYTLATGDTILYAIKRHMPYGKFIAVFLMTAVIVAEFGSISGMMAICVDLLQEWIYYGIGNHSGVIKMVLTVSLSGVLLIILWKGGYDLLEKMLAVLVLIMGFSFLATTFLVVPSWQDIMKGMVPSVPDEPNALLIVAGMAGTTFSSAILYCRSITLKVKGWRTEHDKQALKDAAMSAVTMFLLSFAVMACAAGTLYSIGKPVENTIDMIRTLEPLAGRFANSLFIVGVLGAAISSLIPTILIAPWLISDYSNSPINPKSRISRIFVAMGILICLVSPYINTKPVFLMIVTMALLAVILPLSTIVITILLNHDYLGKFKNSTLMNIACLGAIIFSIVMAYYGVIGLLDYFR